MPEEEPLQTLAAFHLVFKPKPIVLIGEFEEVEQLSGSFHDGERRRLMVVDKDWNTT